MAPQVRTDWLSAVRAMFDSSAQSDKAVLSVLARANSSLRGDRQLTFFDGRHILLIMPPKQR